MALTCPSCSKPLKYAPLKPTFQSQTSSAQHVTGRINLVCSDPKCKGRGTADLDDMRQQARDAEASGNTAAAQEMRSELERLGF